jgi:hypothetical protein
MAANCYVVKADYFKSLVSMFISMNLVFLVLIAVIPKIPSSLINTPNRQFWMQPKNRLVLDSILKTRLFGLLTGINLIFTILSYYVFKANMSKPIVLSSQFHVVMIAFLVIVVIGTVQLVLRLGRKV